MVRTSLARVAAGWLMMRSIAVTLASFMPKWPPIPAERGVEPAGVEHLVDADVQRGVLVEKLALEDLGAVDQVQRAERTLFFSVSVAPKRA